MYIYIFSSRFSYPVMTQWSCLSYPYFIKLSQSLVFSVPAWNVLLSFLLQMNRFLSFALFPLWDLSKSIWKSPALFYLFYPTFLFLDFYFWAGSVSLVVSRGKLLACHPKLTRRRGAVYSPGGLFTLSWLIFFSPFISTLKSPTPWSQGDI